MPNRLSERASVVAIAVLMAISAAACGSDRVGNPTQPTPTPTLVTVAGTATGSEPFPLTATAAFSDGSSRDITMMASWESSNPQLATVSSTGVVTALGNGQVEFRATYQAVVGRLQLEVSVPPPPPTYVLSGIVREAGTLRAIAGARLVVTVGPNADAFAMSDDAGRFTLSGLQAAVIGLEGVKDGYLTPRIDNLSFTEDASIEFFLYAIPPVDGNGATATARCNDGSWSWAQTPAAACSGTSVAYFVCPGPLCNAMTIASAQPRGGR